MLDVLTITLNPAVDQTVHIDDFAVNKVNRVSKIQNDPGGKGINVAAYLAASKLEVGVSGFLGKENTSLFKNIFKKLNIKDKFVYIDGQTRTNTKIVDIKNSTVTDVNQMGFEITKDNLKQLEEVLFLEKIATWYIFSGSLPSGLDSDIYKKWIEKAHDLGIKVALDASGEALKKAVEANPDLIKPNHHELSELVDKELTQINQYIENAKKLIANGIETVCVSMGEKGALIINSNEVYQSTPSKVEVKTTVGAGDAMLSGLVFGSIKKFSLKESLKMATAYSMSAVETVGPYLSSKERIKEYSNTIKIVEI